MSFELKIPDLATNDSAMVLTRWLIKPGERVQRGQPILEIETDKAVVPVECTVTGIVREMRFKAGDSVCVGEVVAIVDLAEDAALATPAPTAMAPAVVTEPSAPRVPAKPGGLFARNREAAATQRNTEPGPSDAARHERAFLLQLYERMVLIREFEERVKFLFLEGTMPGTIHQCQGQEATAVGVCAALRENDFITSTFRGHGHALAKGLSIQEMLF